MSQESQIGALYQPIVVEWGGRWEGGAEANGENSKEAYALPYIKQTTNGNFLYDSGSSNQAL